MPPVNHHRPRWGFVRTSADQTRSVLLQLLTHCRAERKRATAWKYAVQLASAVRAVTAEPRIPAHHGSMNLMNERVFHVENCSCNHKHKCYGKVIGVITGMGSDSGAFPEHNVSSANISMETPRTLTCSDTHHTRNTFTPSHSAYSRTC